MLELQCCTTAVHLQITGGAAAAAGQPCWIELTPKVDQLLMSNHSLHSGSFTETRSVIHGYFANCTEKTTHTGTWTKTRLLFCLLDTNVFHLAAVVRIAALHGGLTCFFSFTESSWTRNFSNKNSQRFHSLKLPTSCLYLQHSSCVKLVHKRVLSLSF